MSNESGARIDLRLEDLLALAFLLINLAMQSVFSSVRGRSLGPEDVLVIIPAVAILLGKELVNALFADGRSTTGEDEVVSFVRPFVAIARDWLPFLVILLMYFSLWGDAAHLLVPRDRDSALMALDQRLFGFQASVAIQRFVTPKLTAWMQFAYAFHLFNIPIVACFIYMRRPARRFRELMCGLIVVTFLGLTGYVLVPALGPMYTLHSHYTVALTTPLDALNRQIEFMDYARVRRDVFPSLHVGMSFVVWLYAWRNSRPLAWLLVPLILSLWISTVYLRYHYLVDCVAGLALAPLSYALANTMIRRWGTLQAPLPASWARGIARLRAAAGAAEGRAE